MRKLLYLVLFNGVLLLMVYSLSSGLSGCTKTGPAGAAGKDGTDANSWCVICHSYANMDAVYAEYNTTKHAQGTTWGTEGKRHDCAACHSTEGYVETWETGQDTTLTDFPWPTPIQCDGCHYNHITLDSSKFDYALRIRDGFPLRIDSQFVSLYGTGNTCGRCHQPRLPSPMPVMNGDSITITSGHWGTHMGIAAVTVSGIGAFNFGTGYSNSAHTTSADCASCHMGPVSGTSYGGHTWKVVGDDGTQNVAACKKCHPAATSFDVDGLAKQAEIAGLIKALGDKLYAMTAGSNSTHLLTISNGAYTGDVGAFSSSNPGKVSANVACALINFQILMRDKSNGVHNYKFMKTLAQNTFNAI